MTNSNQPLSPAAELALFPDTNLFEQCLPLEQLDWKALIGPYERVRLLISRSVQREIDDHKRGGNSRRARRARAANSRFSKLLNLEDGTEVICEEHPRVELSFARRQSVIPPSTLDINRPDDAHVAAALAFRSSHPDVAVAVLTHDTGLALTAKEHELQWYMVPDSWLLPPEQDDRDKEIQQLSARIEELQTAMPDILIKNALESWTESSPLIIQLEDYAALSIPEINQLMEAVEQRYPLVTDFHSESSRAPAGFNLVSPSADKIRSYSEIQYPCWLKQVRQFLRDIHLKLRGPSRLHRVAFQIRNVGNSPAFGTVQEFFVPSNSGLLLLPIIEQIDFTAILETGMVKVPQRPIPPLAHWERVSPAVASLLSGLPNPARLGRQSPQIAPSIIDILPTPDKARNPLESYWRGRPRNPALRWVAECMELRHKVNVSEFPFHLLVRSADGQDSSSCITCRVTARNLPSPSEVRFPIRVHHTVGNTFVEARRLLVVE